MGREQDRDAVSPHSLAEEGLVVSSWDILDGKVAPGNNVLVYDTICEFTGMSVADFIAEKGAKVEIVTDDIKPGVAIGGTSFPTYYRSLYPKEVIMTGDLMLEKMKALEELPIVGEVRGKGLLLGAEFVADKETREPFDVSRGVTAQVVDRTFDRGVLIMPGAPGLIDGVAGDHIAVSPPFTIDAAEVEESVTTIRRAIEEVASDLGY